VLTSTFNFSFISIAPEGPYGQRERERAYLNLRPVSPKPTKHLTLSLQVELVPESGVMIAKAAKAMAKIKARGNPKLLVKELLERIIPPHELLI